MDRLGCALLLVVLLGCGPRLAPHFEREKPDSGSGDTSDPDTNGGDTQDETGEDSLDTGGDTGPEVVMDWEQADATFMEEDFGGGLGLSVAGTGSLLGSGHSLALGSPFAEGEGPAGGVVHVFSAAERGETLVSAAAAVLLGETGSEAGKALAGGVDVNGDGMEDLLVGGYHGADGAGLAWLVYGPISGQHSLSTVGVRIEGERANDFSGHSVDFVGDVDGDGMQEVLIGAYHRNVAGEGTYEGAAYLVDPVASGIQSLDDAVRILGSSEGSEAGYAVAGPGDMDGDGLAEVVIGARYDGTGGEYAGAVYVVAGPATGITTVADADAAWTGEAAGAYAGSALSRAGDVNGDGLADLLVGSRRQDGAGDSSGAAHLVVGPFGSGGNLLDATARLLGINAGDRAGWAVADGGDFNGDGFDDIWVGAPRNGEALRVAGAAYLALGPLAGSHSLQDVNGRILGAMEENLLGVALAGIGDVDGDGGADVLIGAEQGDALMFLSGMP
jgi:hypothetical protein